MMMLRIAVASLLFAALGYTQAAGAPEEFVTVDVDSVVAYVLSCRKPNGAFGPFDQEYTDAAWNYPAVRTLKLLGEKIDDPQRVLHNGLGFPPGHGGYGHWQFFHEHRLRQLLGQPIIPEVRRIEVEFQGHEPRYYGSPFGAGGAGQFNATPGAASAARDRSATKLGYYNLSSLYYLLAGLHASGRVPANAPALVEFLSQRQAPNGGFVDLRSVAEPRDDDASIAHTFQAVATFKLLSTEIPRSAACIDFINACQSRNGGYLDHPGSPASVDVYFTWCGLKALTLLEAKSLRAAECSASVLALQNADGGFGDQPGWRSRLYSTLYAVESLKILHGDVRNILVARRVQRKSDQPIPAGEYGIYQALFKVPVVQPTDLPGLSQRGLNLLGLKSSTWDDAERLLAAIPEQKLPLDVVLCPEAYPHRLLARGGVTFDHVGNFTLDPRWTAEQRAVWSQADQAGREGKNWDAYRERVLAPLAKLHCVCYPEQDWEMEHAYAVYGKSGYNGMLAGFNWEPRDFVRVFPWRERYVDQLTMIADVDAHGDLAKWSPQLDHTRNLFIARGPTYADFLEAAADRRVVCVIANPKGVPSGFTCYGPPAAASYVRQRVREWRWWQAD